MKILKTFLIITYLIIFINVGHFTAPFIWFLIYGLLNPPEGLWLQIWTVINWLAIFTFIWTIIKPKTKRDKILVPIILIILNIPFAYIFIAHFTFVNSKEFILTFTLFELLTILYLIIERKQKRK